MCSNEPTCMYNSVYCQVANDILVCCIILYMCDTINVQRALLHCPGCCYTAARACNAGWLAQSLYV